MLYTAEDISLIEEADNFNELPKAIKSKKQLESLGNEIIPDHLKDFVAGDDLQHREFLKGPFWQKVPAFKEVTEETFLNVKFQNKHTIRSIDKFVELAEGLASEEFIKDVKRGLEQA